MTEQVKTFTIPAHSIDYFLNCLTGNEFKLIMFIWRWTEGTGSDVVSVTNDNMAVMAGVGRSSVSKSINSLIKKGLVSTEKRKGKPTRYWLNLDADMPESYEPVKMEHCDSS